MPREERTANCQQCGVEFVVKPYSKGLYCSRSCGGKAACGQKENGLRWKGGDVALTCAHCGSGFTRRRFGNARDGQRVFCSVACQTTHNRGPNHAQWRGGMTASAHQKLHRRLEQHIKRE